VRPQKRPFQRLAGPLKRHYTFARRHRDHSPRPGRGTPPSLPQSIDLPVYLFEIKAKRPCRDRGSVAARPTISLPSSIG
jgi:hypothetical protein